MSTVVLARPRRPKNVGKWILVYGTAIFFLVTTLVPFVWMAISSIKPNPELYNFKQAPFVVYRPTFDHYDYMFSKYPFWTWMTNTTAVSVLSTGISLIIGILGGYSLARLRFPGAEILGMGVFVTYLVPRTLLFVPLAYIVRSLGLYDSIWALVVTYPTFLIPFCTWLLMGYFRAIPRELEECAMIDGCGRLGALFRIVLPLCLPGIVSAGLFAFTLSWNEFIYALTFTQASVNTTLAVGVVGALTVGDAFFWGSLMGAALLASVPVALLYSFFLEYYVKGLTAGAVKG
ncbi:MAG: carbohydrate ABC transporter permease [Chloroflexota bacterium]